MRVINAQHYATAPPGGDIYMSDLQSLETARQPFQIGRGFPNHPFVVRLKIEGTRLYSLEHKLLVCGLKEVPGS